MVLSTKSMKITFPEEQPDVAKLSIDGNPVNYRLPPATGTHSECFADTNYSDRIARAAGRKIVAYICGAFVHRKGEWADQKKIRFPTLNCLRAPKVLTIIPQLRKFGDLEGALIIDPDLKGDGRGMKTKVPADLSGWEVSEGGILKRNGRILVPYDKWYQEQWDEDNVAVIGIFEGKDSAVSLNRIAKDLRRRKTFWKVDPAEITTPEKRVPVMIGYNAGRLILDCTEFGCVSGCAARIALS